MQDVQYGSALELGDYAAFLRRRWRWILCGVLLGVIIGVAYLQLAPKTYTSTAKVLVTETATGADPTGTTTSEGINLDTEAQLVRSVAVAEGAGEQLDDDGDPITLASNVTVTVPPNTTVLEIAYSASTPAQAQAGAAAFAQAYLDNRADTAQDAIDDDVARLRDRMDDLSDQVNETTHDIRESVDPTEIRVLRTRRTTLTDQLQTLNGQLGPLEGTVQRPGTVIVDPQQPTSPTSPRPLLVMVSAVLLGFLCSLGLAVLREKVDRRPHTRHDLERTYGVPVTAEVRVFDTVTGVVEAPVPEVRSLYHAVIAAYGGSTRSVLVCGPGDQASATAISASLAALAAQSGTTTVHVRRPSHESGLRSETREIARRGGLTRTDHLSLGLVSGGELRHRRIGPVLDDLESKYELAVLDLPTGDPSFDVPLLGRHVDLVLVVVDLGDTGRDEMDAVVDDMKKVGATDVAGVAVHRDHSRARLRRRDRKRARAAVKAAPPAPSEPDVGLEPAEPSTPMAPEPEPQGSPTAKRKSKLLRRGV